VKWSSTFIVLWIKLVARWVFDMADKMDLKTLEDRIHIPKEINTTLKINNIV